MTEQKADTLSPSNANQPTGGKEENAPANTGGTQMPSNDGKKLPSLDDTIARLTSQVEILTGRLTKAEQRLKGRTKSIFKKSNPNFLLEEEDLEIEEKRQPSQEDERLEQEKNLIAFERGITRLMRDAKFRNVLNEDLTLSRVLETNPAALLENENTSVEEALTEIRTLLEDRILQKKEPEQGKKEEVPLSPEPLPANMSGENKPSDQKNDNTGKVKTPDEVALGLVGRMLQSR